MNKPTPKSSTVAVPAKILRTPTELIENGVIALSQQAQLESVAARYAIAVSDAVLRTIDITDPNDPIARQYVPDPQELRPDACEREDPIGDSAHSPLPGLIHRYPDRVLLKPTLVCPVYCRFCFRREMVGHNAQPPLGEDALDAIADYIAGRPKIREVIVSGGDPLALSQRRLAGIIERLRDIEHVRVLRFHSRVPVAVPERISESLAKLLGGARQSVYVMVHANHPRELSAAALAGCKRLRQAGVTLLSQSVLLRGVNDNIETLGQLLQGFVDAHIVPYYLHHPDLAPGTGHFRVTIAEGQALMQALRGRYSGLAQPSYVIDIPGGFGKSPVTADYVRNIGPGRYKLLDYQGQWHDYREAGCDRTDVA